MSTQLRSVEAELRSGQPQGLEGDDLVERTEPEILDVKALLEENSNLRARLAETEETLSAIRRGDVDGLVVGDFVYILDSANAANNRLRNDVLAQMEDAVLAFDANDQVIFMNLAAERQYGLESHEVLGQPKHKLYVESWTDPKDEHLAAESMGTSGAYRAHSIHTRSDGLAVHVESTVSRMRDAGGSAVGYLSVIRDITARVRVEETLLQATLALRDADRRKDEFLATLAHELRNPLAPIRNALQIMKLTSDAVVHLNAREIIQRQLGQMVHLVDDLLDVSRISQGKIELRRQRVDVARAVQNAIETSKPAIDRSHHELDVRLPEPGAVWVEADQTRLCQIVANLLNNAAKYTPECGHIQVEAQLEGAEAVITVRDSGIGLSQEMLQRIFEMFAQVDRSQEHTQGGLGIGLALVKRLVEMHGGSVAAFSDGPRRGSTFVVRLPALVATTNVVQVTPGDMESVDGAPGFRVLVVEDDVDGANSLAQVLQMMGYETQIEHDGVSAVEAVGKYRPKVVLLDIGLPKLNGHEAARAIRRQPHGEDVLLVALSGWGQEEDRRKSDDAGFDHHLVKPVNIDMLVDLLNREKLQ